MKTETLEPMKAQLLIQIFSYFALASVCFIQTTLADGVTTEEAKELRDEVAHRVIFTFSIIIYIEESSIFFSW